MKREDRVAATGLMLNVGRCSDSNQHPFIVLLEYYPAITSTIINTHKIATSIFLLASRLRLMLGCLTVAPSFRTTSQLPESMAFEELLQIFAFLALGFTRGIRVVVMAIMV